MPRSAAAIQTELNGWYATRTALQNGQSVSFGGKTFAEVDLTKVNETINLLERELSVTTAAASTCGSRQAPWARRSTLGGMGY